MRCPGQGCTDSISGEQVCCERCMERFVHPRIQGRLADLYRTERGGPAHVTLVASVVKLLKEGEFA